jgi:hypothetical protein
MRPPPWNSAGLASTGPPITAPGPAARRVRCVARLGGQALAAGTAAGAGAEYGIVHLALAPVAGDAEARDAVLAVLASLVPHGAPGRRARVCLPAPHPATRPLLAAGWRNECFDLFMATDPGLLDPRRAVPSPPFA